MAILPHEEEDFVESNEATDTQAKHYLENTTVLLVEDDRTTQRLVRNYLSQFCTVAEAPNATIAINQYTALNPDIVFLDLDLPDTNGFNVMSWIKQYDPEAYIIIFSANTDSHYIQNAMDQGAHGYIKKPFNAEIMLSYIQQCPKLQPE